MTTSKERTSLPDTVSGAALAGYAVGTTFEAIPPDVVERAKMLVFDQLACTYVGMELPEGVAALRYAEESGARPRATLVRSAARSSPEIAAWVNGTAGHAAELDCAHVTEDYRATGHPGAAIVPAVVAVAEHTGASGRDLVNAVVLGLDVGVRSVSVAGGLSRLRDDFGLYGGTLHSIGAAVAARLFGLEPLGVLHAAALAIGQSLSPVAFFEERRHMSKSIVKGGQPARAGVAGATMAALGIEATDDVFAGRGGLIDTWGEPGREGELTAGLGTRFEVMGANLKFHAAGYPIHAPVEAVLDLVREHGTDVAAIDSIVVGMPAFAGSVVDSRNMPTICVQDMLAVALHAGGLTFDDAYSETLLADAGVRRLRERITVEVDPELERTQPNGRGARVTIRTAEGSVSGLVPHPRGHRFRTPAPGWADLRAKWAPTLERRMGEARFEALYAASRALDGAADLDALVEPVRERAEAPAAS